MVHQSLWDHLNVPLPDLDYELEELQEQEGKQGIDNVGGSLAHTRLRFTMDEF
jgi:hypothetical protein